MNVLPTRISARMTWMVLILLAFTTLIVYGVLAFVGKPQLVESGTQAAQQTAAAIAGRLNAQLERIQGTATAIAHMAENLPHDEALIKAVVPPMIDQQGDTSVPGGGFGWAPNAFASGVERKLLFWSRGPDGKLVYHDDYNQPNAPRYFEQPWFLAAKAAKPGQCHWAEAFREPVSGVAMTACHVPFYVNGTFAGVIGIDLRLDGLAQMLQIKRGSADSYAFAVDQAGNLLYFPGLKGDAKTLPTIANLAQQQPWFAPVADVLKDKTRRPTTLLVNQDDARAYVTLEPMSGSNWWVGVVMPESEVVGLARQLTAKMLLVLLPLLAVLLGLAWLAGRRLLGQLHETTAQIESLGERGMDAEPLEIHRDDELGELRHAVNRYAAMLQSMLRGIALEAVTLETKAKEMAQLSSGLAERAESQREDNTLLATAITEMSASADEVARNTNECSDTSDGALQLARRSQGDVQAITGLLHKLATDIQTAATEITQLGLDIEKVGGVLEVIEGISQQTNLLALNAAIEAARAGEQGRGFAVVADEVRTLAGRTQLSAGEIQTIITNLCQTSQQAVLTMQAGATHTQTVVENASGVSEVLGGTVQSFADIANRAQQIAVAAQEQNSVTHDIGELAVRIHAASEQNAQDIAILSGMGQELQVISTRLAAVGRR